MLKFWLINEKDEDRLREWKTERVKDRESEKQREKQREEETINWLKVKYISFPLLNWFYFCQHHLIKFKLDRKKYRPKIIRKLQLLWANSLKKNRKFISCLKS